MGLGQVIAANLKRFRAAKKLSQTALAEAVGVSLQTIWSYENDVHLPQVQTLVDLAKALGVRPWQLLAEEHEGGAIPPDVTDLAGQLARACGLEIAPSKKSTGRTRA